MQIISKERIWMEFKKILSHHSRNYVLKLMQTHGILPFINIYDELYKCHENIKNPVTAMVAHFRTKTYDIGKSWKWSKAEQNLAKFLIDNYNKKLDIMEGLAYYNYPREYMYELALLENRSDEDKNKIMTIEIPEFKVNGNDLMSLGFAGKQIKEELFRLKKIWRDNNYK
jgi:tRNA nucleotidyltransferase/poly(A) polymerase